MSNLFGQIRRGAGESDLLKEPAKEIFLHYLQRALLGVVDLIIVLLLYPLSFSTASFELAVFILAFLFALYFIKGKTNKALAKRIWLISIIMFISAALAPFLVYPKPLYFARTDNKNPFSSDTRALGEPGQAIGSVLMTSELDPVRGILAAAFQSMWPDKIIVLKKTGFANGSYYRLPCFQEFETSQKEPGEIVFNRSICFPFNAVGPAVSLRTRHDESHQFSFDTRSSAEFRYAYGAYQLNLIDYTYTQYPETIPWDCVFVAPEEAARTITYCALLDRALRLFAEGNSQLALQTLDCAGTTILPSNLEACRASALQFMTTYFYFAGNIGRLQALPKLHKTYELFEQAQGDPRFNEKDPLCNWLRRIMLAGYDNTGTPLAFFDRVHYLKARPSTISLGESYSKTVKDRFNAMSFEEMRHVIESSNLPPIDLHLAAQVVAGRFYDKFYDLKAAQPEMTSPEQLNIVTGEAARARSVLQAIQKALPSQSTLLTWSQSYLQFLSSLPQIKQSADPNVILTNRALQSFKYLFDASENRSSYSTISAARTNSWYSEPYANWFVAWGFAAFSEISARNGGSEDLERFQKMFPGHSIQGEIKQYGIEVFTKDRGGKGQTFVPGLFCLAWYTEKCGGADAEMLKSEFQKQTLIPFDEFVESLKSEESF